MTSFPLPADLPPPVDDGAAAHLVGMRLPAVSMPSTHDRSVDLRTVTSRWLVVFCYPMTGRPDVDLPLGWNDIPGARGCTPQNLSYQNHLSRFAAADATVFGVSVQDTYYQREMVNRLGVAFEVVSDADLAFCESLRLPTFEVDGMTLLKRLTLVASKGVIEHVIYPVFPPDEDAAAVVEWLENQV